MQGKQQEAETKIGDLEAKEQELHGKLEAEVAEKANLLKEQLVLSAKLKSMESTKGASEQAGREEKERLENEAREAKRKNKKFIVGVKIQKPISKKPYVEKKEKKKDVISDEQKEMKKFLGQEFMEEFTLAEAAAGGAMAGAAKV